jgi:hypothetical protein
MYMCGRLRLPGSANQLLALNPSRGAFGFLAQALCLFFEALIEWGSLFEVATLLHALLHSVRGRRERNWRSHHRRNTKDLAVISRVSASRQKKARTEF